MINKTEYYHFECSTVIITWHSSHISLTWLAAFWQASRNDMVKSLINMIIGVCESSNIHLEKFHIFSSGKIDFDFQ